MSFQSHVVVNGAKPLFFYENVLFFSRKNRVFSIAENGKKIPLVAFRQSLFRRYLDSFKLFYRAKRSGVRSSAVFDGSFYFSFDRKLYCYNVVQKSLSLEYAFKKGHGPLSYSIIEDIARFDDCLVYGEYYGNAEKNEISLFGKYRNGDWKKVYTFSSGLIDHVHNLVPDKYNDCVWILAGDFDQSASIWRATDNFGYVECVVSGKQIYRSCVAFPMSDGLLYATDSQLIENSVRILKKSGECYVSERVASINGPAIYGTQRNDYFIFSTSTEPEKVFGKRTLRAILASRPAPCIKKNQSDLVALNKDTLTCTVLLSRVKDRWPYLLLEFGALIFPSGTDGSNGLYFYSIGNKKNDLCTEYVDLSVLHN